MICNRSDKTNKRIIHLFDIQKEIHLPGSITLLLFDNGAGDLYDDCWGGPDGDAAQLLFIGLGGASLGVPKGYWGALFCDIGEVFAL